LALKQRVLSYIQYSVIGVWTTAVRACLYLEEVNI